MGGKVFGVVNYLNPGPTTLALIGVLLLLVFLQVLFEYLEKWAELFGQIEIYNKLQYELMILGLISFSIFIIQVAAANDPLVTSSEYFISFDFAHILVLFIAFSFIAQALILVQFAHYDGKEFLKMVRVTEDELLEEFRSAHPGETERLLLMNPKQQQAEAAGVKNMHLNDSATTNTGNGNNNANNNNTATNNHNTSAHNNNNSTTDESKIENNNNNHSSSSSSSSSIQEVGIAATAVVEPMVMITNNSSSAHLLPPINNDSNSSSNVNKRINNSNNNNNNNDNTTTTASTENNSPSSPKPLSLPLPLSLPHHRSVGMNIHHHSSAHSIHSSSHSTTSTSFLSWAHIYGNGNNSSRTNRISLHKSDSHRVTISSPFKSNNLTTTTTTTTTNVIYEMPKKFWRKIEFKIVEELFLLCHHFPKEFNFGAYVSYQLHTYIAEVGEASWVSWLALAVVAMVNYIKTIVDNVAEEYECRNQPVEQLWGCDGHCDESSSSYSNYSSSYSSHSVYTTGSSSSGSSSLSASLAGMITTAAATTPSSIISIIQSMSNSVYHIMHTSTQVTARVLAGGSGKTADFAGYISSDLHCYLFFYSYCFVCAFALNIVIFGIYYASCYYEHAMIQKGIKEVFPDLYTSQHQHQLQQHDKKKNTNKINTYTTTTTTHTSATSTGTSPTVSMSENCVSNFKNFAIGASSDTHVLYIHVLQRLHTNRKLREDEVYRRLNLPLKPDDGEKNKNNNNNDNDDITILDGINNIIISNKNGHTTTSIGTNTNPSSSTSTGKGVKITSDELERITIENERFANKRRHERELKKEKKRLRSKSLHINRIPLLPSTTNTTTAVIANTAAVVRPVVHHDPYSNNNNNGNNNSNGYHNNNHTITNGDISSLPTDNSGVVVPLKTPLMTRLLTTFGLSSSSLNASRKYHNNIPYSSNSTSNINIGSSNSNNHENDDDDIDDDIDYDEDDDDDDDQKDLENGQTKKKKKNSSHNNDNNNNNNNVKNFENNDDDDDDDDDDDIEKNENKLKSSSSLTKSKPKPKVQLEPISISTTTSRQTSKQILLLPKPSSSSSGKNYVNEQQQHQHQASSSLSLSSPRCKVDTWSVFWLKRPDIYFFFVEFAFLLQCFYLAIYFTQILPMAIKKDEVGWGLSLFIMPIIGFRFLYLILHRSVILHATTKLNKQLVGKVCEEAILEITLSEEVRIKVNEYFSNEDLITDKGKFDFVKKHLDPDHSNEVDKVEFRTFLGSIDVYLSKSKFELLWKLVDDDLSGSISMDEIFIFLFPEMKRSLKEEMKIVSLLRKEFQLILMEQLIGELQYIDFLQQHFDFYDTDHSGSLDKEEVREMIGSFNITIEDDKSFELLMATMNTDDHNEIEFLEFVDLVLPLSVREEINIKNGRNTTGGSGSGVSGLAGSFMKALSPRSVYNTLSNRLSSSSRRSSLSSTHHQQQQQLSPRSQKSQNSQKSKQLPSSSSSSSSSLMQRRNSNQYSQYSHSARSLHSVKEHRINNNNDDDEHVTNDDVVHVKSDSNSNT